MSGIKSKANKDIKVDIEKNDIKNKLDNTIKNNSKSTIKSTRNSINNNENNFVRAVGTSNVKLRKSSTMIDSNSSARTISNIRTASNRKSNENTNNNHRNSYNNNNDNNRTSRINTLREKYINRSQVEDDETKNLGTNTITEVKRNISNVDERVRQFKHGIQTGKSIVKGTIRTGRTATTKVRDTKMKLKRISNGEIKITRRYVGNKIIQSMGKQGKIVIKNTGKAVKGSSKIIYRDTKEEIRNIFEDKNNDLAIQGTVDAINNLHTGLELTKRTANLGIKIRNHHKVKKEKNEYSKIQTKRENYINTQNKNKIHTKSNEPKIKTVNNKIYQEKLKKKRYDEARIRNRSKQVAEKVQKEAQKFIKKITEEIIKSKLAGFIAVALIMIVIVNCLTSLSGFAGISSIIIPNIDDPQTWITEMNRIDTEANRKINSADRFRTKGSNNGADWRSVIAVYMAKYENEPPDDFGKSSGSISSGGITGEASSETTFTGTYSDIIKAASEKYGVDANLIAAVIRQESNFNPNDVSPVGAAGLMQIMPSNFEAYGISNPFDPYQNVMGGTMLLQELCEKHNNDLPMVLAEYNAGGGTLQNCGVFCDEDIQLYAPEETKNYVPIVLANYEAYKNGTPLPEGEVTGVMDSSIGTNELSKIYYLFNTLTVSTSTETVKHKDGSESKRTIKTVTLEKHDIEYVMNRMSFDDNQKEMVKAMLEADAFSDVIPNFDFKFKIRGASSSSTNNDSNVEIGTGTVNGTGTAATDEQFKQITNHIEECIGTPYVMGGTTPGSQLDCSGFVSYVFTQCGIINGRYTAQGLCDISKPVSESELKPGDLIFFQNTYDCGDTVTHVAIYTGDGMMAHSGHPCQYASYETAYWQEHFYGYGRLT